MRLFHSTIAILICLLSVAVATAQDRAAPLPSGTDQSAVNVSQTQDTIDRAAAANRYVFLFFWKDKSPQLDKAWGSFEPAVAKMADAADFISIRITNPAEKKIVDKYGVSRAPMPIVLAIAPSGAVTKAFTKTFDEKELRTAFVSPCTERCLKALQSRKLVFVCVVDEEANPRDRVTVPKGVEDFKADKKYGAATEVVLVNARDAKEATFLKELEVSSKSVPITVFLAPPGAMIGKFGSETSKEVLVAKLVAAQSNPCAGGKCGSGGCGPKK
jgi:hypothetical protein